MTNEQVPKHVAIIMDGNGRWAKSRGLPRHAGHRAGTENLRRIIRASADLGIKILTVYAFSTENWGRPEREVRGLLNILSDVIDRELRSLHNEGVRLRHLGDLSALSPKLQTKVQSAVEMTRENDRLVLNIAWNYGGRQELVHAIQDIVRLGIPIESIDEDTVAAYLYTAGLPDPDLIIRTSGELRVSNFLIWQGAYAEYYVTPTLWPEFDRAELEKALSSYAERERRFGALSE